MCAGSLAPGCWILGIFATSSQVYGAHGCHLACLVPLLWRPGGPWDDPGTLEGTRKDPGRSRLGFYWFFVDFGNPFWELFTYFWTHKEVFFISISRLFFLVISGSKFGCLGLQKQAFGKGGIAKINFRRNWISYDSRFDFSWFWVAFWPIFMTFVALETGLKIDDFSWWFWGHPRSWDRSWWKVNCSFPGPK